MSDKNEQSNKGYEERDVNVRLLTFITLGVIVGLAIVLGATGVLKSLLTEGEAASVDTIDRDFPEPGVQVAPAEEMKAYRKQQKTELTTYGWADRGNEVVRIPIDRAMRKLAAEGLPESGEKLTRMDMLQQKTREAAGER